GPFTAYDNESFPCLDAAQECEGVALDVLYADGVHTTIIATMRKSVTEPTWRAARHSSRTTGRASHTVTSASDGANPGPGTVTVLEPAASLLPSGLNATGVFCTPLFPKLSNPRPPTTSPTLIPALWWPAITIPPALARRL